MCLTNNLPQKGQCENFAGICSVQFGRSVMSVSCDPMNHSMPGLPVHHQLPTPLSRSCHPTISSSVIAFSSCLQSFPASGSFQMSQLCIRWPKYWSFSFNISPSIDHPGLVSFKMDWLDLFAAQLDIQYHSAKASIHRCSAFFTVQLSHPYMTTGKTTVLTRWTFAGKVMSLLFNMLSRLVITFLPRSVFLFHGYSHHLQ